jgi:hypothetical protein
MVLERVTGEGDAAMLPDHLLQKMYDLAYCLHPDRGVALSVTLEACERIALIRRMQDRRAGHYRRRLPEACLPQYCVYLASTRANANRTPATRAGATVSADPR